MNELQCIQGREVGPRPGFISPAGAGYLPNVETISQSESTEGVHGVLRQSFWDCFSGMIFHLEKKQLKK